MIEKIKDKNYNTNLALFTLILLAIVIRIYFFVGLVFSDDSYYNQLSYLLLKGKYVNDFIGYPIFLLRKVQTLLVAVSMFFFGTNEVATILPSFFFSMFNLILLYHLTFLFTQSRHIALIAVFLLTFFPVDVIFATINFADLSCAFFITLGIYFLYKSYLKDSLPLAILSGSLFFTSLLIKENFYYIFVLLIVLAIYLLFKEHQIPKQILISLSFFLIGIILEGLFYLLSTGNFFYRFYLVKVNYSYCYYDFFPYTLLGSHFSNSNFFAALFKQIFFLNTKYLFLRRFYLLLPLVALVQSIVLLKKQRKININDSLSNKLLVFWFLGLVILMLGFTTSFTDYKPLDLRRSWYIFIILSPVIILAAMFIRNVKTKIRYGFFLIYFLFSLVMDFEFHNFFDTKNKLLLKNFIKNKGNSTFYSDHHTKYSIDLIDKYKNIEKHRIILGENFTWSKVNPGDFVIYNKDENSELKLQGHKYPSFEILNSYLFDKEKTFGKYIIYKRIK